LTTGTVKGTWIFASGSTADGAELLLLTVLRDTPKGKVAVDDEGVLYRVIEVG
jgi:hypothetical protein